MKWFLFLAAVLVTSVVSAQDPARLAGITAAEWFERERVRKRSG